MKIEVNKNELAGAMIALGKLVCRTSTMQVFKSLKIEAKSNTLRFSTCSMTEQMTFKMSIPDGVEDFCAIVGFDEFRDAVRGCRNKTLSLESGNGTLVVGDRTLTQIFGIEWLEPKLGVHCGRADLQKNFVEILSTFAPIVDRNDARPLLRGINFSHSGITATNGKELLNLYVPEMDVGDLTIPLPIALMQSKTDESGRLDVWELDGGNKVFAIETEHWTWVAKALNGVYPNWKNIVPPHQNPVRSLKISPDDIDKLITFLKNVPDKPPKFETRLYPESDKTLGIESGEMQMVVNAEFTGDWSKSTVWINKNMLIRLLSEGHNTLEFSDGYSPLVATGGIGKYVAMPLYPIKNVETTETEPQVKTEIQTQTEDKKMEKEENKVVSMANVRTFTPNTNTTTTETETVNPLDDLVANIEGLKLKLKSALDEAANLARKVREAQLKQKQKEREFVQARRALERVRMAI